MTVPGWLILDLYVMLIDGMLLAFGLKKKQRTRQDHSFMLLLGVVIALLAGDMMSRCNPGGAGGIRYAFMRIGTYIIFVGDPFGYLATLYYIDSWTGDSRKRSSRVVRAIINCYVVLNAIMITISDFTGRGWFYSFIDRIYQRGPLYVFRGILNMIFCLFIGLYVLIRQKDIRTDYRNYVIAFPVIVLFAGMLQVFVGGAAYEYAGTIFACLLLYIYVQNHNMDTDYLTGLLNRKGIDAELEYRIRQAEEGKPFAGCLLDLDFFKNINDECGHGSGDEALRTMADLLRKAFGRSAIIARYGGDEFFIIRPLDGTAADKGGVEKLGALCEAFNAEGKYPFRLGFSAGYEDYDPEKYPTLDSYIRRLDHLMYEEKSRHHAVRQ